MKDKMANNEEDKIAEDKKGKPAEKRDDPVPFFDGQNSSLKGVDPEWADRVGETIKEHMSKAISQAETELQHE